MGSGLFLLLQHVKQCPCRGGSHGVVRVVKGFFQEGNDLTTPNMPEGANRHNFGPGSGSAVKLANREIAPAALA